MEEKDKSLDNSSLFNEEKESQFDNSLFQEKPQIEDEFAFWIMVLMNKMHLIRCLMLNKIHRFKKPILIITQ